MKFIMQTRGYGKTYYERERRKKKMKDDARKILDYLKDENDYIEDFGIAYKRIHIDNGDLKLLLDYIEEIEIENRIVKDNNRKMQEEMCRTWEKLDKPNYSEIKYYKFLRDIKDIIRDREVGYMETCDILETVINKELEKYE